MAMAPGRNATWKNKLRTARGRPAAITCMEEETTGRAKEGGTILSAELDEYLRMYMGGGKGEGGEEGNFDEGSAGGGRCSRGG